MEYSEFKRMIESTGMPSRYDHFGPAEIPDPPYITWYENGTNNFKADNVVYQKISRIVLNLYTRTKSPSIEKRLEDVLKRHNIPWDQLTSGRYIREEDVYLTVYEFDLSLT